MAITYQGNAGGQGSTTPITTTALGEAVNSGDLIIALVAGVQTTGISYAVTDNLNSGSYSIASNANYVAGYLQLTCFYKVCNASGSAGTTTVTVTGIGAQYTQVNLVHYNGFVNTPTLIAGDVTSNSGDTSTATGTGFNNSKPNELLLALLTAASGSIQSTASGWTPRSVGSQNAIWEQQQPTSGNAISFSSALTVTDFWLSGIVGVYDAQLVVPGYSSAAGLGPG